VMVFYRGDLTNIATKYILSTSAEATVFKSTGTLNQQAVTVVNWFTQLPTLQYSTVPGNAGYSGYNLVGNPYASSIDWDTFSTSTATAGIYGPGVGTTIYMFNEVAKTYATYSGGLGLNGGSHIISSGQGFFVKATGAGASLTFNEAAKTNSQVTGPTLATGSTLLLSTKPVASNSVLQYLRLELAADSINKEETIVKFDNSAKNGFVFDEDSQYMPGSGGVSLSSISPDTVSLAINAVPFPKLNQTAVKLNVNALADGTYTLNMTELKEVPQLFQIWLKDAFNKDSLDMKHNPSYSFNITKSDTNTYGSNRFKLIIRQDPALGLHLLDFAAAKASNGSQVVWKTENEENYTNFTVERSTDGGLTFGVLGGFASNALGTYSFLDRNPLQGVDQYRLKLEDINGSMSYSKVVTLMYGNANSVTASAISIYPNPAIGKLNLSINPALNSAAANSAVPSNNPNKLYGIRIVSSSGSVLKTASINRQDWETDVSSLMPGTYFIQVVNSGDNTEVGKGTFVKL
jgi:hypothetical protein